LFYISEYTAQIYLTTSYHNYNVINFDRFSIFTQIFDCNCHFNSSWCHYDVTTRSNQIGIS